MWQRVIDEWDARIRVLVENASPALRFADFGRYRDAGLDVRLCSGPEDAGDVCPLLAGERCPYAERADVVLFGFGAPSPILRALRDRHPSIPVVVEVPRGEDADLPAGCTALPSPASVDEQVRVLVGAVTAERRSSAGGV